MQNLKILIVDDEEITRMLIAEILRGNGFEVTEAENGEEALECLEKESPKIIFLDSHMPVMGGFEVADFLNKNNYTFPIVIMSADNGDEFKQQLKKHDIKYCLNKPFKFNEMLDLVKHIIEDTEF